MPQPKKGPSLGSSPSHQRLMLRGLARSLFEHERLKTTEAKAKLLRPYAERLHPLQVSAWTMFGGLGVLLAVGARSLVRTDFAAVTPGAWGAVLYSGVVALVVAYLFYYRGVRVLGPTRTAMFANLQPLIALVVAYMTLGETPTGVQLAGAAAIMVGLLVSRR